ncbi:hypothetical protein ACIGFK_06260 [Streptomyces sp. NPDC085524]
MNQSVWKPADHRLGTEEWLGTIVLALAGGLILAGMVFAVFLLLLFGSGH